MNNKIFTAIEIILISAWIIGCLYTILITDNPSGGIPSVF